MIGDEIGIVEQNRWKKTYAVCQRIQDVMQVVKPPFGTHHSRLFNSSELWKSSALRFESERNIIIDSKFSCQIEHAYQG